MRAMRSTGYATGGCHGPLQDSQAEYSLAVLDWNLPRQDGLSVLKAVRASGCALPHSDDYRA